MEIVTKNASETSKFGEEIGANLAKSLKHKARVIALSGDLGSGKTTFVRGIAKGLKLKAKVTSPTFILMRRYSGKLDLYHLDLYRLEGDIETQVRDLGLFDLMKDKKNVIVIEWAEKIKDLLPKETIRISFKNIGESERKIVVE